MSAHYVGVGWNRRKLAFDAVAVATVGAYLFVFRSVAGAVLRGPEALSGAILDMRAWGSCAFLSFSAVLAIGPLARIDRRFLPLVYNRRHLGVITACVAVVHAWHVLGFYHQYGPLEPARSLLTYDVALGEGTAPFPLFGMIALAILVVLGTTSHDYWQKVLGGARWKSLHMLAYAGYALVVLHVLYGALQHESAPGSVGAVLAAPALVASLHLLGAWRSSALDAAQKTRSLSGTNWLDAGPVSTLRPGVPRRVVPPEGERIALLLHDGRLSALHGVCAHQGGPLDEGRVVDGCLTCPWHGWQYRPEDGCSPPPFEERLPVYRVRVEDGRALVDPRPLPAGTPLERPLVDVDAARAADGPKDAGPTASTGGSAA